MKFVHIEDFFHPDAGYQVNILAKLQVKQGHEIFVIAAELEKMPDSLVSFFGKENIADKDNNYEKRTGVKIIRIPVWKYYSGRVIFKKEVFEIVKKINPDVLFLHCESTFTTMSFLLRYNKLNLPVVTDSHMLEMASKNRFKNIFRIFYKAFITPVINKNEIPMIRVVDSDYVDRILGIPLNKTHLLSFGTDVDYFQPDWNVRNRIREELGIGLDDFVVIYAGKLDEAKGGLFLAESLKNKITLDKGKKICFIIIGNLPRGEYGKTINKTFIQSENKIIQIKTQTYLDLAKYYQTADIAIFPKQCSLSYYDVQSSELPVVLEINEINVGRVEDSKGMLFSRNNSTEFRNSIIAFGNMDKKEFECYKNNSRKNVIDNFNYVIVAQKFTDIMVAESIKFKNKRSNKKLKL